MEEHHEAYFVWKRLGIRQAWCWHFDAHLDIGREGLTEARTTVLAGCHSSIEAQERGVLGNCYLPWGGLHCGNYLYPAIAEGLVGRLTWVIPPYLPVGDLLGWARRHLDGWFELSLAEYASFEEHNGYVRGHALGIPMEVGTWETLPRPAEPVLVDVDIDYFLTNEGEVWWPPDEIAAELAGWSSLCTTVAYSVKGGYTPTSERFLANPFLEHPLVPGYQADALDQATTLYRCHRYEEAVEALGAIVAEHPVVAPYYIGSSQQKLQNWAAALEAWEGLCEASGVPADGKAYLHGLCGEMALKCDRLDEALRHAAAARKLAPGDYRHPWTEAMALEAMGDGKGAIKVVRRALRLAEGTLFSLRMHLALARLYRRAGNRELSKMELGRLASLDVTGEYRASTSLV